MHAVLLHSMWSALPLAILMQRRRRWHSMHSTAWRLNCCHLSEHKGNADSTSCTGQDGFCTAFGCLSAKAMQTAQHAQHSTHSTACTAWRLHAAERHTILGLAVQSQRRCSDSQLLGKLGGEALVRMLALIGLHEACLGEV